MNGMAASDKIFKFLGEEEPKEKTLEFKDGDIVLSDVHFSYDADREVLHGVDLQMKKGCFTAIVGESGSGKSTVASLLMGKYTLGSGSLTIDGTPLSEISERSLMKAITRVGSNSVFFKGSVRDNLRIACPEASDQRLWEVLADCEMESFLRQGEGLDTLLLENASNLSGGQRQRLALARAILHDSPIYIFDEATSNIDVESEEAILRQIKRLSEGRTVIMISHRLANVVDADCIYCMVDGTVGESGRHPELLSSGGAYARLWNTQIRLELYGKEAM